MGNSNTVTQTIKKNQEYISDMNKIKVKYEHLMGVLFIKK